MYTVEERGTPATFALIAINVIVWLFTVFVIIPSGLYGRLLYEYGVVPILIINGFNLYSLITHMFIHDGSNIFHIFLNMYALLLFGRDVERVMGTGKFLLLYFLSGIIGSLLHIFYFTSIFPAPRNVVELNRCLTIPLPPCVPAIGASGAVFGVMASFGALFPTRRLFVFLGWFLPVAAPAIVIILLIAIIQTISMLASPFSSIAYTAHVGGFLTGLTITLIYRQYLKRKYIDWYT